MDAQTARGTIRSVFGDALQRVDVIEFPAGNLSITLGAGTHTATIDGHPDSGWGLSVDPGEDEGFSGHEETAATLEEALRRVRAAFAVGA
ncbi:hypothetical protein LO771_14825 [Streptacidiphilus sp. ASG 303]|uniref:hypothetical protein n=1 Tax=Streptacidiphilus sp. ASG 303 TaxID=2896847 RepID=UPI001E4409BC|nr:hypothetical protein [Streptacidiphilus sp. ASG 303]MCD0483633.1 hypothetical protein [Streptacidiphilus sp. ASG 303]